MKKQLRTNVLCFLFDLKPKSVITRTLFYFLVHMFISRTLFYFLINMANVLMKDCLVSF